MREVGFQKKLDSDSSNFTIFETSDIGTPITEHPLLPLKNEVEIFVCCACVCANASIRLYVAFYRENYRGSYQRG